MKIVIGVFIVLIIILILLILLALFVPVRMIARSSDHYYAWHWGKLLTGKFIPNRDEPKKSVLKLKILFWEFEIQPLESGIKKTGPEKKKKKRKPKRLSLMKDRIKSRLLPILNTFHVDSFRVNIDTDDYVLNGILYPVFQALSNEKRNLEINFNGIVDLEVNIRNHGWRLVYAFFR